MRRNWDLVIYILIGGVVAFGAYWSAFQNVSDESLIRWGGLAANTLAVFGWVIKQSRRFWRSKMFWATIGTLLIVHTVVFYLILKSAQHWRMGWFFLICTAEVIPISATVDWAMSRFGKGHRGVAVDHGSR